MAILGQILKIFSNSIPVTLYQAYHMNKAGTGRIDMEASMAGSTILPYPAS